MILRLLLLSVILCLASSCAQTERTEDITAQITAAQMEGRNAAKNIVNSNLNDTVAFMRHVKEVRDSNNHYLREDAPDLATAFDSAYVHTIKTVFPSIKGKLGNLE